MRDFLQREKVTRVEIIKPRLVSQTGLILSRSNPATK